jgi:hypothetical protein
MADEIKYAGNTDLFIAAALNQLLFQKIVDRTDLRALCQSFGSVSGTGSLASQIAQVAMADAMVAANVDEVTAPGNTDLTTDAVNITVARQVLVRTVTDLYALVGGPAPGINLLAQDMANAASLRFTDMICGLFPSLSQVAGSTGQALSVDDIADAHYKLIQARVGGQLSAVLSPKQLTDFLDSLRGEGGSAAFNPATEAIQSSQAGLGYGLQGSWRGINFWSADSVTTVSTDKVGAMFGPSAYGYMEAVPADVLSLAGPGSFASVTPAGAPIFVEFERDAARGHTKIVGNYFVGVAEMEDAAGVKIVSSAT